MNIFRSTSAHTFHLITLHHQNFWMKSYLQGAKKTNWRRRFFSYHSLHEYILNKNAIYPWNISNDNAAQATQATQAPLAPLNENIITLQLTPIPLLLFGRFYPSAVAFNQFYQSISSSLHWNRSLYHILHTQPAIHRGRTGLNSRREPFHVLQFLPSIDKTYTD